MRPSKFEIIGWSVGCLLLYAIAWCFLSMTINMNRGPSVDMASNVLPIVLYLGILEPLTLVILGFRFPKSAFRIVAGALLAFPLLGCAAYMAYAMYAV